MALTLTIPGGSVQLSGNRVQAEVETDTITGALYKLLLKTTSLDASFPEGIDAIEPDDNDKAVFDIRNRVTLPLVYSFTWPLTGAVYVAQSQMAKKVALDIGERFTQVVSYENVDTVNWAELAANNEVLILKGGISKHLQAKYNEQSTTFYQEWIAAGKFLTMLPDNMRVLPGQPVKLWYITPEVSIQTLALNVIYTNIDGTPGATAKQVIANPDTITELNVDPATLGLNAAEVASYELALQYEGNTITEIRTFQIDQNYYENKTFLLYANQVGGIDSVWLSGRIKKMFPTESERSQRDARITDTQQRPTREVDYKNGRRKWTINSGFKYDYEIEALTGLFESRNVWLLDGNDIIPVMVDDGDNEYFDTMNNNMNSIDINITEAH
jgi:hypothetical protein